MRPPPTEPEGPLKAVQEINRTTIPEVMASGPRPANRPPRQPVADPSAYTAFLQDEQAARRRRVRRYNRQMLAWVLVGALLPLLALLLHQCFFN